MVDNEMVTDGSGSYDALDITVPEGLEAVRKHPGTYIGSTGERGSHRLVYEVVNNSADEVLAGYADHIEVTIFEDGDLRVADNDRGIPVGEHPSGHKPITKAVMTTLHAGDKSGDGDYAVSDGLHGVGISVVNALSARVGTVIRRRDYAWRISFANGGHLITELVRGEATEGTGTTQTFYPGPEVFETIILSFGTLRQRSQRMAFLNRDLCITLINEQPIAVDDDSEIVSDELGTADDPVPSHRIINYMYEHDLRDCVEYIDSTKKNDIVNAKVVDFESEDDKGTMGVGIAM